MAALTADRETPIRQIGILPPLPVAASTKIYAGSIVAVFTAAAPSDHGGARPAADAANIKVIGVAELQADNSGGAFWAITVDVIAPVTARFDAVETGYLAPGSILYVVDDHTVGDATGTNSVKAGVCIQRISSTEVWIYISPSATY